MAQDVAARTQKLVRADHRAHLMKNFCGLETIVRADVNLAPALGLRPGKMRQRKRSSQLRLAVLAAHRQSSRSDLPLSALVPINFLDELTLKVSHLQRTARQLTRLHVIASMNLT